MSATSVAKTRYSANRTGKLKLGRCVFAEKTKPSSSFSTNLLRLREIEKIITDRYGKIIPETDDSDVFIEAAAYALNTYCKNKALDLDETLHGWCARWAPWALPKAGSIIRLILNNLVRRTYDMKADAVASLLNVSFAERSRLNLKTIGSADIPRHIRRNMAKELKRERDRNRQAAIRRVEGRQDRNSWLVQNSLSITKPWKSLGISRRTWYRKFGTGLSRVDNINIGDTPVPNGHGSADNSNSQATSMLGSGVVILANTGKGALSLKSQKGADNTNVGAEQNYAEEPRRIGGSIV